MLVIDSERLLSAGNRNYSAVNDLLIRVFNGALFVGYGGNSARVRECSWLHSATINGDLNTGFMQSQTCLCDVKTLIYTHPMTYSLIVEFFHCRL